MCYKTYCFAFQKRLFCTVKAYVLRCKRAAFATSKRSYRFLTELFLQNLVVFLKKQWKFDVVTYFMDKKENRV